MTEITITRHVEGSKGRYVARVADAEGEGVLSYSIASPTMVIADHTGVDDSLRGRGIAHALAARLVEDARAEGFKIVPLCPFVNAERRKHPEWSEVFQ
ncbi:MAG: GNAT family N-acetyltransferase [Pseudomonadota bacterium]